MIAPTWRREWTEIAAVAVVSYFLYQINMLMLFLIPLEILYVRKPGKPFLVGCAIVFIATALTGVIRIQSIDELRIRRGLAALEVALPAVFVGGVAVVNIPWPKTGISRRLFKLLGVAGAFGLVSIPVILYLARNTEIESIIRMQIETFVQMFRSAAESDPDVSPAAGELLGNTEEVAAYIKEMVLRNFVFSYFVFVSGSIWIGDHLGLRTLGRKARRLTQFRVPAEGVWVLIGAWTGVLLDLAAGIGALRYVFWNVGMIALFVYGIQGLGIVRHFLDGRGIAGWMRVIIWIGIILILLWPGVNLVVILGIPGIGVSETWINYRSTKQE